MGRTRMEARRRSLAIATTVAAVGLASLFGCSEEPTTGPTTSDFNKARQAMVARVKKHGTEKRAGAAKPVPTKVAATPSQAASSYGTYIAGFNYDPTGKRDPFRSFEWEQISMLDDEIRGPLEQFDVNQLSLVGVIWATNNARALIQDPAGQGYVVGAGARIGKNEGRVIRIQDNLVVVEETYVDFLGEQTTKDIEMRIRRSEGG